MTEAERLTEEAYRLYDTANRLLKVGAGQLALAYNRKAAKTAEKAMLAFVATT